MRFCLVSLALHLMLAALRIAFLTLNVLCTHYIIEIPSLLPPLSEAHKAILMDLTRINLYLSPPPSTYPKACCWPQFSLPAL